MYVRDGIKCEELENLRCCNEHETLWLKLKPVWLPGSFTSIIIAVVIILLVLAHNPLKTTFFKPCQPQSHYSLSVALSLLAILTVKC